MALDIFVITAFTGLLLAALILEFRSHFQKSTVKSNSLYGEWLLILVSPHIAASFLVLLLCAFLPAITSGILPSESYNIALSALLIVLLVGAWVYIVAIWHKKYEARMQEYTKERDTVVEEQYRAKKSSAIPTYQYADTWLQNTSFYRAVSSFTSTVSSLTSAFTDNTRQVLRSEYAKEHPPPRFPYRRLYFASIVSVGFCVYLLAVIRHNLFEILFDIDEEAMDLVHGHSNLAVVLYCVGGALVHAAVAFHVYSVNRRIK